MATAMTNPEEMKQFEEQFVDEVFNHGDFSLFEKTVSEDYVGYWFDPKGEELDYEGFRTFIEDVRGGFSDFKMEVEYYVAEDDKITVAFTTSGTHDGEFMGIPPTDEYVTIPGIFVHRFDDEGNVVEGWAVWDALAMLQQLDLVPETFTLASFLETGAKLAKRDVLQLTKGK